MWRHYKSTEDISTNYYVVVSTVSSGQKSLKLDMRMSDEQRGVSPLLGSEACSLPNGCCRICLPPLGGIRTGRHFKAVYSSLYGVYGCIVPSEAQALLD